MEFAQRIRRLGTEAAFAVLARVQALQKQGRDIIRLEMGEPDWPTPEPIIVAGIRALQEGKTRYTQAAGDAELRAAIAKEVARARNILVKPEQVIVGPGAKPFLFLGVLALINPGDEVIVPDPGFPIFASAVEFAGGKPVPLPLRMENQFRPDLQELQTLFTKRTKLVIVNSPHNPTGGVWEVEDVQMLTQLVGNHKNCWILSDEVYAKFLFDGRKHTSPIAIPDMQRRTLLVDSFSKPFAMTGWRLGYAIMPEPLAEVMTRLNINVFSCVPPFIQEAGCAALAMQESQVFLEELQQRRDELLNGLRRLRGFACLAPQGGLYAFAHIAGTGYSAEQLQNILLEEVGVACIAGTAFGSGGKDFLRFSLTEPTARIQEAIQRMERVL